MGYIEDIIEDFESDVEPYKRYANQNIKEYSKKREDAKSKAKNARKNGDIEKAKEYDDLAISFNKVVFAAECLLESCDSDIESDYLGPIDEYFRNKMNHVKNWYQVKVHFEKVADVKSESITEDDENKKKENEKVSQVYDDAAKNWIAVVKKGNRYNPFFPFSPDDNTCKGSYPPYPYFPIFAEYSEGINKVLKTHYVDYEKAKKKAKKIGKAAKALEESFKSQNPDAAIEYKKASDKYIRSSKLVERNEIASNLLERSADGHFDVAKYYSLYHDSENLQKLVKLRLKSSLALGKASEEALEGNVSDKTMSLVNGFYKAAMHARHQIDSIKSGNKTAAEAYEMAIQEYVSQAEHEGTKSANHAIAAREWEKYAIESDAEGGKLTEFGSALKKSALYATKKAMEEN